MGVLRDTIIAVIQRTSWERLFIDNQNSGDKLDNLAKTVAEAEEASKSRIKVIDLPDSNKIMDIVDITENNTTENNTTENNVVSVVEDGKASAIATGCLPCAMGHLGTCTGLINESIRFAHGEDGVKSPEVIDRVIMCMNELNSMERVDLRPEMIVQLDGWERDSANRVLRASRDLRHTLEAGIPDVKTLENIAANIDRTQKEISREWFQKKASNQKPTQKPGVTK